MGSELGVAKLIDFLDYLSSRSIVTCIMIMLPNAVGPVL